MSRPILWVLILFLGCAGCGGEPTGAREVSVSPTSGKPSAADTKAVRIPGKAIATH